MCHITSNFQFGGRNQTGEIDTFFVHIQSTLSGMDFQPTQPLCSAISLTTGRGHHFLTSLPPLNWHPVLGVSHCPCHPCSLLSCCRYLRFKMCGLFVSSRRITPCLVFIAHCGTGTYSDLDAYSVTLQNYITVDVLGGRDGDLDPAAPVMVTICRTTVAGGEGTYDGLGLADAV